jgi:hypothetical protein
MKDYIFVGQPWGSDPVPNIIHPCSHSIKNILKSKHQTGFQNEKNSGSMIFVTVMTLLYCIDFDF